MQPITHSFTVAHLNKYTGVLAVSAHAGEPAVKIVTYNSIKFKVKQKKNIEHHNVSPVLDIVVLGI